MIHMLVNDIMSCCDNNNNNNKVIINSAKAKTLWSLNNKICRSQLPLVQCRRVSTERDHCLRHLGVSFDKSSSFKPRLEHYVMDTSWFLINKELVPSATLHWGWVYYRRNWGLCSTVRSAKMILTNQISSLTSFLFNFFFFCFCCCCCCKTEISHFSCYCNKLCFCFQVSQ